MVSKTQQPGVYQFRYWGTFAKVLRFNYIVDYSARRTGNTWHLEGESDLGLMGGVFHHRATVSEGVFNATYRSKWDDGAFEMTRPR